MKESEVKFNVNVKIIPFGHISIEIEGHKEEKKEEEKELPVYLEPKTTNPQLIEITFDGENYSVPKTTGGFF